MVFLNQINTQALILQEIRDESHRFAIQAQRNKRKENFQSELDSIKGVRKLKRILTKFKNIKNIKSADIKELMTVEGINEKIAKEILDKFKTTNFINFITVVRIFQLII